MRVSILLLLMLFSPHAAHAEKLPVVASFGILGDMAREVGGEHIALTVLSGAGGDPHAYQPSPADAGAVAAARLVIVNGLGFEGFMDRLIAASGYAGPVAEASRGIAPLRRGGHPDPHAWQDLANGKIYAANIRDALIRVDPVHAADYRANTARYIGRIEALDAWARQEIARVPEHRRKVIATHDAFAYFSRAYGVTFLSAQGMSPESAPSAAALGRLIDRMRHERIRALFMETGADPRLVRQLEADGGGYRGGALYADALSPPNGSAPTYLDMFSYNISQLVSGMQRNP